MNVPIAEWRGGIRRIDHVATRRSRDTQHFAVAVAVAPPADGYPMLRRFHGRVGPDETAMEKRGAVILRPAQ
ncbi:hypothetical protein WS71_08290 [Burkholderia mayonis]|uniref:Uncharacterized protein n=1 Tax=Burkholderia mayonis TaxID=1385591 RepID=A0A1B4FUH0_9BURK|nr:hypothetical protein WS71_08290 [Burkholderia mayonis]